MASPASNRYSVAPLFCRPWTLNGIPPRLIESHYENNYGGAVARLNALAQELEALDPATTPPDVISRLKRDELAALNSTLLHELYFASLGGDGRAVPETMAAAMARDFGSVDRWRQEFVALARRSRRRLRLGAAHLRAARPAARQPCRLGSRPDDRGRHPDPRARHVRACLSPRVRRQRDRLRRRLHAQHRLERRRGALSTTRRRSRRRGRSSRSSSPTCRR